MVNPLIIGEHVRLVASASGLRRARRWRQRWLQPSTVVLLVLLPIVLHCPHCHPCRHYPHRQRRQRRCWHRCVVVIVAGGIVRPSRPLIAPAGCCVSPLSPYHRAPPSCPLSSRCASWSLCAVLHLLPYPVAQPSRPLAACVASVVLSCCATF